MKTLCGKGYQFYPVTRHMHDGLALLAFFRRYRGVEVIGQCHRLQLEKDRVQMRIQQQVRPLCHAGAFGKAHNDTRQIIIFRAGQCGIGYLRVFKLADVRLNLRPERYVLSFFGKFSRRHVGKVELSQGYDTARKDNTCIAVCHAALVAERANDLADHVLLACEILRIKASWQPDTAKLIDIYHIGFMPDFG